MAAPTIDQRPAYLPYAVLAAVAAFVVTVGILNASELTHYDLPITIAGLGVGFVVGLTGMGGGALMTPILVLLFGVQPLTAVSSDLVVSLVMKPIGGGVHLRRGTVHRDLVKWLVVASVPAAFTGVLLIRWLGGPDTEEIVKRALGVTLLIASAAMIVKTWLQARRTEDAPAAFVVRRLPTALIGLLGGLVVGMTSVGSGSLMIIMLMFLYPRLTGAELVGTDLVQAIPLVGSAALGHLLFGEVEFGLTGGLLLGALPGVYLGARCSASAPDKLIRPVLAAVLVISGYKLLTG
jgi:uncharacterized protein